MNPLFVKIGEQKNLIDADTSFYVALLKEKSGLAMRH